MYKKIQHDYNDEISTKYSRVSLKNPKARTLKKRFNRSNTTYIFYVRSKNKAGWSEFSNEKHIRTLKEEELEKKYDNSNENRKRLSISISISSEKDDVDTSVSI